jgi:GR25 family glycosyltransferase involved in LPS biosynthesis
MLPIFVITLEKSTQRREAFARLNNHVPFEFVTGVDAATVAKETILGTGFFEPGLRYTIGAHGAALSHYGLWDRAVKSGQALTVAEDDAIFRLDFAQTHVEIVAGLRDWDFVLWGFNLDSVLALQYMPGMVAGVHFDYIAIVQNEALFQVYDEYPALVRLQRAFGLPAYSVSPEGARKLKEGCFPLKNFSLNFPLLGELPNEGLDVAASKVYPGINAFVSLPPLVISKNDQSISTIQNTPHF